MNVSRRQLLAMMMALPTGSAACTIDTGTAPTQNLGSGPSGSAPPPKPGAPTLPATPPASLAAEASAWVPGPGEVSPGIKRTVAAFLETAGTWTTGGGVIDNLTRAGAPPAVAATATVLQPPDTLASSLRVVYPQYGGIAADQAAVIILFDQELQHSGGVTRRQMALDVRLRRQDTDRWAVERINPLTSLGVPNILSSTASAVLAEPRITLSGPAQLDVGTGRMNDRLLSVLLGLARDHVLSVQVMHTGHIQIVFPTARVSNHAVGRAVDIREIDGLEVVSPDMTDELLFAVMRRASELGATEVGGPFDLNGERTGFFSDNVHQDHLHIGITPGDAPAHLR